MPNSKTYSFKTERLLVRCYDPTDAPLLKEAIDKSLNHLKPWMPWASSEPETLEQKRDRLRMFRGQFDLDQDFVYGIFSSDNSQLLGSTGLHTRIGKNVREIGYWVHIDQQKKGYINEAVIGLIKLAFEVEEIERLEIHCDPHNEGSKAIPERLGFTHEATLKNRVKDSEGQSRDAMIWTLFREDYQAERYKNHFFTAYDIVNQPIKTIDT